MRQKTKMTEKMQERIISLILREMPFRASAPEIQKNLAEREIEVTIEQCRFWRREVDRMRGVELEHLAQKLAQELPSYPTKAQILAMSERLGQPLIPGHYKRLLPLLKAIPTLWQIPRTGVKKITLRGADLQVMDRFQAMTKMTASECVSFLMRAVVVSHERGRLDLAEMLLVSMRLKDDDLLRFSQHFDSLDMSGLR